MIAIICSLLLIGTAFAHSPDLNAHEHQLSAEQGHHDLHYDHEQFLGPAAAKEFDTLTSDEAKRRLKLMLPKIDKDNNGSLTIDELKTHIEYMSHRYVEEDAKRCWSMHTRYIIDGNFNWTGYMQSYFGTQDPKEIKDPQYQKLYRKDKRRWRMADGNQDDVLDLVEFRCFVHPESCPHTKILRVDETLDDMDRNKDDYVTFDEYILSTFPVKEDDLKAMPEWMQYELNVFQTWRDKNNDTKMDRNEIREWLMPSDYDSGLAEARHLLALADDDKDGVLSYDEIVGHHEVFVGSQATNYGNQLKKHDPTEL